MSGPKSLKKFCRLTKYIEQVDKDLHQVIEDLCISHYFKPSRDTNGVTFLYPKEKSYRQKIINAAYSTDPDVAVNMIKSLILRGHYADESAFDQNVTNMLNQRVEIESATDKEVKLVSGAHLTKDPKFVPMGYRDNMAVYILAGKGEIPLDGPSAESERPSKKKGGANAWEALPGTKKMLHGLLENRFVQNMEDSNNIYVKKVALQLHILLNKKNIPANALLNYLGNDEFSDSYMLDMFCQKNCTSCFNILYNCLKEQGSQMDPRIEKLNRSKYMEMKRKVVGDGSPNNAVSRVINFSDIKSPMDIRSEVHKRYKNDKKRMGKDLFIVFCNVCRDLWNTDYYGKVDSFKNFAFLASNVYTDPEQLTNQEFDIARDLTLYGNLLKSDVLLYVPQADFSNVSADLQVSELPSPLGLKQFSLCNFINRQTKTGGGEAENMNDLLEGL